MKKCFVLILLSIILNNVAVAQKVTKEQALEKAKSFLKGKKLASCNIMDERSLARGYSQGESPFYIFNAENQGGFVIVSGDSRTEEILGYSDKGNIDFDNMPDNMRAWLDGYAEQIEAIKNVSLERNSTRGVVSRLAIPYLVKAEWSQGPPYNDLCPEINGQRCVTGCVATALAQIMYYYKYPKDEIPEIPEYTTSSGLIVPKLEPTKIQWDVIQDSYDTAPGAPHRPADECREVAKLMRYCGQALKIQYSLDGTGGGLARGLSTYLGFSKTRMGVRRDGISSLEWESILYREISEGRPVILTANSHAFICDGYDENGLFHINWGWGGKDNGYYLISLLCPDSWGRNDELKLAAFVNNLSAVINLKPGDDDNIEKGCYGEVNPSTLYTRREYVDEDFIIGITSDLGIYPDGEIEFDGELAMAFYINNNLNKIIPCEFTRRDAISSYWNVAFGSGWADGIYQVRILYKGSKYGEWEVVPDNDYWEYEIAGRELMAKKTNLEHYNYSDKSNIEVLSVNVTDNVKRNTKIMTIGLRNNDDTFAQTLTVWIDGVKKGRNIAFIDPGESGYISIEFHPDNGHKDYEIYVENGGYSVLIYQGSMDINPYTYLVADPFSIEAGSTAICYINLNGKKEEQFVGYSFDALLPKGLSVVNGEGSVVETGFSKKNDLQITHTIQNGVSHFDIMSKNSGIIFSANDTLLAFMVQAENDIEYGLKTINITNVKGIAQKGENLCISPTTTDVRVMCLPLEIETEAGKLSNIIMDDKKYFIKSLKLKGTLNGTDFKLLRDMAGNNYQGKETDGQLRRLDMSEASIVAGGDKYLEAERIIDDNGFIYGNFDQRLENDDLIPKYVFVGCDLENVNLPNSVSVIGDYAFWFCHLVKVFIPHGIEMIGTGAFQNCEELVEVSLPSSLMSFGKFVNCKKISRIVCAMEDPFGCPLWDDEIYSMATLVIPKGSKDKYLETDYWKEFKNIQEEDFIRVKANPVTIHSGDEMPAFTYTVEGGTLEGEPHFYCEADGKTPGEYEIKILQGTVSNEYVIFENGELTVLQGSDLQFKADDIEKVVNLIMHPNLRAEDDSKYDIDHNGKIDVSDLVKIINIIKKQ